MVHACCVHLCSRLDDLKISAAIVSMQDGKLLKDLLKVCGLCVCYA